MKWLRALALLGLLSTPAHAVVQVTRMGNANVTATANTLKVITNLPFTAPRVVTLPPAASSCIGQSPQCGFSFEVLDSAQAVGLTNTITVTPFAGDTINGSTSSIVLNITGGRVVLWPVTGSGWSAQIVGLSAVAAGLTVGTSVIANGTTTRILYDNAGVLGEYTLTGTGTVVVMATAPTIASPVLTTPALGIATATSLAIGGATISTNALAATGPVAIGSGTITANAPIVFTQTWNNGAAAFEAFNINITDTASSSGNIMVLNVGGAAKFYVTKSGASNFASNLSSDGQIYAVGNLVTAAGVLSFAATTFIVQDANDILAQRDGVNPQTLRVYGTWTNASNGDWLSFTKAAGGAATISTVANGTGTAGNLDLTAALVTVSASFTATGATVLMPALASVATTSSVCFNTGTGLLTYNATVGTCTVSTITAKDLTAPLTPKEGFDLVMAMEPWRYTLKQGRPTYQPGEQIGMIAERAYEKDHRVVAMNPDGTAAGFRYEQYTAALTAAVQYLKADNDNLAARLKLLEAR